MGVNNIRFTEAYVRSVFEEKGCTLLSPYVNTSSQLEYICKCKNVKKITFNKFKSRKHGCRDCTGLSKYTQDFVELFYHKFGCEVLSEYKGANKPLSYRCSCGKISTSSFSNFMHHDKRCPACGLNKLSEQFKLDIDYIRNYFIENNCKPLFEEYKGVHVPLRYICECGYESKIAFADFQNGKRCWNCRTQRTKQTMYNNGTGVCSLQQKHISLVIGGELNYPVHNLSLDIAFPNEKIYVEYDGSGHNLGVILRSKTKKEFEIYERNRRYALFRANWKEVRIISRKDNLPSVSVIKQMYSFAHDWFSKGHSWITFDIDEGKVITSDTENDYPFGNVSRIRL